MPRRLARRPYFSPGMPAKNGAQDSTRQGAGDCDPQLPGRKRKGGDKAARGTGDDCRIKTEKQTAKSTDEGGADQVLVYLHATPVRGKIASQRGNPNIVTPGRLAWTGSQTRVAVTDRHCRSRARDLFILVEDTAAGPDAFKYLRDLRFQAGQFFPVRLRPVMRRLSDFSPL